MKLSLFGAPAVARDGAVVSIRLKRCGLLLAMLAATPQGIDRGLLAEQLWEEGDAASRLRRLRRLVFECRAQLGENGLLEQQGRLQLHPDWLAGCDYAQYLARYESLVHRGERIDDRDATFALVSAARAPLLGDWEFDERSQAAEWLDLQRVSQPGRCRRMRDRIIASLRADGAHEEARALLLADIERDPLDEAGWEQAASMLFEAGRYAECMALYQTLRGNLAQAVGVDVSAGFRRLAQEAQSRLATQSVWGTASPVTRYVRSGDAHIAYQCFGAGPDLLLIPGFVSNVEMAWELPQLASFFAQLAASFRVIIFDRRGVGLSDRTARMPGPQTAVEDVLAVLDAVDSRRTLVFGASEGGPISIQLCTTHPQRVAALCLYGALARGTASGDYTATLTPEQYDRWLDRLVADWGTGRSTAGFAPSHANDPMLNDWWARLLRLSSSPGSVSGILEQLRDTDVTGLLPQVSCPTTLIHRRGDHAVRIDASRYMAQRIPRARLVELDGDDHWWWLGDTGALIGELKALATS